MIVRTNGRIIVDGQEYFDCSLAIGGHTGHYLNENQEQTSVLLVTDGDIEVRDVGEEVDCGRGKMVVVDDLKGTRWEFQP